MSRSRGGDRHPHATRGVDVIAEVKKHYVSSRGRNNTIQKWFTALELVNVIRSSIVTKSTTDEQLKNQLQTNIGRLRRTTESTLWLSQPCLKRQGCTVEYLYVGP